MKVPSPEQIDEAAVSAVLPFKDTGLNIDELLQLAECVKKTITEFFDGKNT